MNKWLSPCSGDKLRRQDSNLFSDLNGVGRTAYMHTVYYLGCNLRANEIYWEGPRGTRSSCHGKDGSWVYAADPAHLFRKALRDQAAVTILVPCVTPPQDADPRMQTPGEGHLIGLAGALPLTDCI